MHIYVFMDATARSKLMSMIRSQGTSPEMALRKALWHSGLRYRVAIRKGKIDIAFPRKKIAIFADGCFWHSCPIHGHTPKSNTGYWKPKLERNVERAVAKDMRLMESGWVVLHFWEHEIMASPQGCISVITLFCKTSPNS